MSLELRYFVLKPSGTSLHAEASRAALTAYAEVILHGAQCDRPTSIEKRNEMHQLALDVQEWVRDERAKLIDYSEDEQ